MEAQELSISFECFVLPCPPLSLPPISNSKTTPSSTGAGKKLIGNSLLISHLLPPWKIIGRIPCSPWNFLSYPFCPSRYPSLSYTDQGHFNNYVVLVNVGGDDERPM